MIKRRLPEVLAPAGNLAALKIAVDFGADAVYCGGSSFGMRASAKNLSLDDFKEGAAYAHERGSKVYVTINALPKNSELEDLKRYIPKLEATGIDAVIVSDMGVLMLVKELAPDLELHISTQAGVTNYATAMALYNMGAKRVVLARELDLDAIASIRAHTPKDLEIECFVHGSMCMAFSGRCLLSQYLTGRDANHGECAQTCRWKYAVMEEKRPGQYLPLEENENGTYIFNSEDMCMIEHVADVIDAGVGSLKIEGRAKSAYYTAAMANAYKMAVNEYMVQRGFEDKDGNVLMPFEDRVKLYAETVTVDYKGAIDLPSWILEEPYKVAHRPYSTGFFYPENKVSQYTESSNYIRDWLVVGEVVSWEDTDGGRVTIECKNKLKANQEFEILIPGAAPLALTLPAEGILDAKGNPVDEIRQNNCLYSFPLATQVPKNAMLRARM